LFDLTYNENDSLTETRCKELIKKYRTRVAELEFMAKRFEEDAVILKEIKIFISELEKLLTTIEILDR